jgi:hypothetical protein
MNFLFLGMMVGNSTEKLFKELDEEKENHCNMMSMHEREYR